MKFKFKSQASASYLLSRGVLSCSPPHPCSLPHLSSHLSWVCTSKHFFSITGITVTSDIAIDDISLHSCDFHDYTETLSDGTTCPVGQAVRYTGCKAGVPAPYTSCAACGGKTVGPCSSGPVCQVLHGPIPSTGMYKRKREREREKRERGIEGKRNRERGRERERERG